MSKPDGPQMKVLSRSLVMRLVRAHDYEVAAVSSADLSRPERSGD
jgi:hypothetical protein